MADRHYGLSRSVHDFPTSTDTVADPNTTAYPQSDSDAFGHAKPHSSSSPGVEPLDALAG